MEMSVDLAMNNLSEILTEVTEDEESVCYVTENDAETLQVAINTMCKYQKICKILDKLDNCEQCMYDTIQEIEEVRDRNDD